MSYIFLDESGQFSPTRDGDYFVVASFTVDDPRPTAKSFRGWYACKFPKQMRRQAEIKWSATGIDNTLRVKTLKHISRMGVRIRYVYFKKKNIPDTYQDRTKGRIESGLLYTNVIGELLEMYMPLDDSVVNIICDRRKLKGLTTAEFRRQLRARLHPNLPKGTSINIEMADSTTNMNIQIADWIVGAIAWSHEGKSLGAECVKTLNNNFLGEGKELFGEPLVF